MPPRSCCSSEGILCKSSSSSSSSSSKSSLSEAAASSTSGSRSSTSIITSTTYYSSSCPHTSSSVPSSSSGCCCEWPLCSQYALDSSGKCYTRSRTITTTTSTVFNYKTKSKIMSLHHHHHQQQQQQHQQHHQPISTTTTTTTINAATQSSISTSSAIQRSSSTSPHHHQHHHQQHHQHQSSSHQRYSSSSSFQQHQHRHLHHHYLPPRPPSTTSSGSLSTTGFPEDLQDDLPLPPTEFSFHPAHHQHVHHPQTLQFHRHTSPYFTSPTQTSSAGTGGGGTTTGSSSQQIHHHHHHHFVPPVPPPPSLQPVTPPGHHSGTAHSSRTASRQTYQGDEGEDEGVDEENLLLVDNSVGVQDAVCLDPVTTDNFLTNIVQRFKREFIYTYVGEGTLLVSVNPYKPLSIFSPRVKAAYRNISNPFQLPPHIYGQLCLILQRNTSSLERTQTLLLTGESGSGKTTNLSYLLDFLATKQEPIMMQAPRSRRNSGRSTSGGSTRGGSYYLSTGSLHRHQQAHSASCPHSAYYSYYGEGVVSTTSRSGHSHAGSGRASSLSLTTPPSQSGAAQQSSTLTSTNTSSGVNMARLILQGNFLLNAFGNCKTSKNCDASRYGKLLQLQVDFLGNICGGRILSYQLEKWRVQGPISGGGGVGVGSSTGSPDTPTTTGSLYERNFHIFYILLIGADSSTLKSLRLTRNLETYAMLNVKNHSSFLNASQTNPSTPFCPHDHYYSLKNSRGQGQASSYEGSFQLVKRTLSSILSKTSSSTITPDHVFKMLAAILKLNNLVFAPVANIDGTEGCDVTNEQDLHDLGELLSIKPPAISAIIPPQYPIASTSPATTPNNGNNNNNHNNHQHPLKTILTTRKVTRSDGSTANLELTSSESSSLRNSLTVSLYTRLFAWLTKQISFAPSEAGTKSSSLKHNLLNVVDFYGFEVFQTNSIEQFLINFTNEKIQFVLGDLRLRMLQEEFVKDGLEWITIDTAGATPPGTISTSSGNTHSHQQNPGKLIDLVEENCHGLLSIFANCANDHELERQFSRRFAPSSSSGTVQDKEPTSAAAAASSSTPSKSLGNSLLVEYLHQCFRLRHWAGPVVYSTRHFATKNRDTLPPHLPHQLYTCSKDPLLKILFSHDGRTPAPMDSSSRLLATSNMELSLRNLFQKCSSSSKHHRIYYIRCLKPNELSQPEVCELALLKHQVKYHRLIDFVRVYRDGFCYNLGAFEFLERYKLLSLNTWPNWRLPHDPRLGIQVLMKDLQMREGLDWCFGGGVVVGATQTGENLKVYLKGQRILSELEDFRRERLDDLALLIQKVWRGYRDWRTYERMKDAHEVICKAWKRYLQCKRKDQRKLWKQMKASVRLIQQHYILWKRRLFLRQLILQVRAELQQIGGLGAATGASQAMCLGLMMHGGASGGLGLPSVGSMLSPVSRDWPYSPSYLEEASFQLRRVFHRWRCRLYRSRFNEIERAKMAEKVTASLLFKDKKSSYSRSVSHPFLGDYIRLRQNSQWRRTTMMMMLQSVQAAVQVPAAIPTSGSSAILQQDPSDSGGGGDGVTVEQVKAPLLPSQQLQIVFADLINKITRSSGKFLPIVLVVTTTQIMILDPRTLNIKYKIPATEVWRLSMSPYGDDICVLHLQQPMRSTGGSVVGPGEQGNLFGGLNSDDDDAYYQYGDEPSPTVGNFGAGGCVCSSSVRDSGGPNAPGAYYAAGIEQPSPSPLQHQCQATSGGCGLFGGGNDNDSGHYVTSEVVKLTKGDVVLHTCHLIEMVTKIYLVVKNATGKGPEIIISNEFPAVFNNQRVQLYFRYSKQNPKGSKQHNDPVPLSDPESGPRMSLSPPPLPDGPIPTRELSISSQNPVLPIPPPPPPTLSTLAIPLREEPVIPPSQIKITRKKSTRMEFLIGHS